MTNKIRKGGRYIFEDKLRSYLKIKKWHGRKCCIEGTDSLYYFPTGRMFFGNKAGNEGKSSGYYWIEMQCNDTNCNFRAVVNTDYLSDLIKT